MMIICQIKIENSNLSFTKQINSDTLIINILLVNNMSLAMHEIKAKKNQVHFLVNDTYPYSPLIYMYIASYYYSRLLYNYQI